MTEPRELVLLSRASQALEQASTVDEVKDLRDKAEAVKAYARKAKLGHSILIEASLIKVNAERKLGEILRETELARAAPGNQYTAENELPTEAPPTLASLGISKSDSSRLQQISTLPDEVFDRYVQEAVASQREPTTAGLLRLAKQQGNGVSNRSSVDACSEPKQPRDGGDGLDTTTSLNELVGQGRTYGTVYADPPWPYKNQGTRAATCNHYATMSVDAICDEPVAKLAGEKAHLHLWTTNAFLLDAFDVIEAWGFQYKSCFVWVKPQIGIGNYWRVSHEFMLLGVRGGLTFADRGQRSWLEEPRTSHSQKPDAVRQLIELVSLPAYLELYGRKPVKGWTVYGNQVS
jgi:N6-adenosine-specific RNA methylase IME4